MFRVKPYVARTDFMTVKLDAPLTFPGNGEYQEKNGHRFTVKNRNVFFDWFNAVFLVDYTFEAVANGANIAADTQSAPINGSFSLIKTLAVKSGDNVLYKAEDVHKAIFIKNQLEFSNDFSRSVAKKHFRYLHTDATTVTADDATNTGMLKRALKPQDGATVQTLIPLNRYSFFENRFDKLLPPLQLEFEIELQDDREMIFQNDGTARRIVVAACPKMEVYRSEVGR